MNFVEERGETDGELYARMDGVTYRQSLYAYMIESAAFCILKIEFIFVLCLIDCIWHGTDPRIYGIMGAAFAVYGIRRMVERLEGD